LVFRVEVRGWLCGFAVAAAPTLASAQPPGDAASIEAPSKSRTKLQPPPVVQPPRPKSTPPPVYPEGASGDAAVLLELTVSAAGVASDVKVVAGTEPFASRAVEAARTWTFEPALRADRPVAARIRFELRFHAPESVPVEPTAGESGDVASPTTPVVPLAPTEVLVQGVRSEAPRASFSRAEVREIPGTFGDPFRAVEVLPGVTPIVTGLPYFFVRGAPPGNVGYFLDGVRVPLLFHFALGPSVIHPGLVERVDLYAGGYPARYGRYSGGIVAAETAAPKPSFHGEANLRLFDAGALFEAPLAGGRGHALIAGRYSFAAGLLSLVAPDVNLQYWDYQFRAGYDVGVRDSLSVFAFGAYDLFTSDEGLEEEGASTQFHRVDLRWDHQPDSATRMRTALTLGRDNTQNETTSDTSIGVGDSMLAGRFELEHRVSPRALFRAGADVLLDDVALTLIQRSRPNGLGEEIPPEDDDEAEARRQFPSRLEFATGIRSDVVLDVGSGVSVTPGLRFDLYHSDDTVALGVDPRISARFDVAPSVSLEHSFGVVHQLPSFVIPVPGLALSDLRSGLQKSLQSSAGVEWRLGKEWTTKLTLFQNAFFDMTDLLSLVRYGDELDEGNFTDRSLGQAYGLEFTLRRPLTRKLGGYLAYTLSRSERTLGSANYVASFDRTHVLHLAAAYDLGRRWRVGSRFTYYSGVPSSVEVAERLTTIGPNGEVTETAGTPSGPPLHRRAPDFFRLDLRVEKRWLLGSSGAWLSFIMEVLNTTLSRETVNYTCDSVRCDEERIGPVTIPSIGLEAAF
jgi:TonB family protein